MFKRLAGSVLTALCIGCAGLDDYDDRSFVSESVETRSGFGLGPEREPGETAIPEGVDVEDGLSEEEAVAIALWNNAAFQEALTELGFARADLIQAGMLTNPVLSVLFPVSSKQLEFAATLPLELFWLRWSRIEVAELEFGRVAGLLVQTGLDLVRDAKVAHAGLVRAGREAELARQASATTDRIAEFFAARLRAGDVSELEAGLARVEAHEARREAARLRGEAEVSRERLREVLGLSGETVEIRAVGGKDPGTPEEDREDLVKRAWASRPDLRAAELGLEAASERAGLARWEFFQLSGILDANDRRGKDGLELGPGIDVTIPIFNRNEGGKARADAALKRAVRRYVTVRHSIARQVGESLARYRQARSELEAYRSEIVPGLERALDRAGKAHEAGQTSVLPVLRTEVRLFRARDGEATARAALRGARAEVERSIGNRIGTEEKP